MAGMRVIYAAIAVFNVGIGMIIPILPLYAQTYGASTLVIGWMVSALGIGRLLMQGPGGFLADRYRDSRMASLGIGLFIPTMLLMALLPHPYLFVALRFVEGLAEGIIIPSLYSIVARRSAPGRLGASFGTFTSFATAGLALGPLFGGFLTRLGGPRTLFLVTAAMAALVAGLLARLPVPAGEGRAAEPRAAGRPGLLQSLQGLREHGTVAVLAPAGVLSFLMKLAFAAIQVVLPLYLAGRLGAGEEVVGLIFSLNFFLYSFGQPAAGWLSDRLGSSHDVLLSGAAVGLAFLLLPLASSVPLFVALFALEAFAASWVTVSVRRLIGARMKAEDLGKAYGMVGSVADLGTLIGPLLVGAVYPWRPEGAFLLLGGMVLLGSLLATPLSLRPALAPPD